MFEIHGNSFRKIFSFTCYFVIFLIKSLYFVFKTIFNIIFPKFDIGDKMFSYYYKIRLIFTYFVYVCIKCILDKLLRRKHIILFYIHFIDKLDWIILVPYQINLVKGFTNTYYTSKDDTAVNGQKECLG